MPLPSNSDFQLCYVEEGGWAYFANVPPGDMWGDDWNDAPHYCNAGTPYVRDGQEVVKVAYDGDLETVGCGNGSWYSVQDFNARKVPWLAQVLYGRQRDDEGKIPRGVQVWAGCTIAEFTGLVESAGGHVYAAVGADA